MQSKTSLLDAARMLTSDSPLREGEPQGQGSRGGQQVNTGLYSLAHEVMRDTYIDLEFVHTLKSFVGNTDSAVTQLQTWSDNRQGTDFSEMQPDISRDNYEEHAMSDLIAATIAGLVTLAVHPLTILFVVIMVPVMVVRRR